MKFSMNGFRRQLSGDIAELRNLVDAQSNGAFIDEEELIKITNDLITKSNVLNCAYSDDDPDFSDLSDVEVEHIETEEEV